MMSSLRLRRGRGRWRGVGLGIAWNVNVWRKVSMGCLTVGVRRKELMLRRCFGGSSVKSCVTAEIGRQVVV